MNDKERFEELAYNVGISLDGEKAMMSSDDYDFLYNYALEQVERVEELEEEVDRLNRALHYQLSQENIRNEENRKLKYKNKRYREALEFYADENNYREQELKGIVPPRPITFKPILHDYGSIARQALEGEE